MDSMGMRMGAKSILGLCFGGIAPATVKKRQHRMVTVLCRRCFNWIMGSCGSVEPKAKKDFVLLQAQFRGRIRTVSFFAVRGFGRDCGAGSDNSVAANHEIRIDKVRIH